MRSLMSFRRLSASPLAFALVASFARSSASSAASTLRCSTKLRACWSSVSTLFEISSISLAVMTSLSSCLRDLLLPSMRLATPALKLSMLVRSPALAASSSALALARASARRCPIALPSSFSTWRTCTSLKNCPSDQPPKTYMLGPMKRAECPHRPPSAAPLVTTRSQRQSDIISPKHVQMWTSSRCRSPSHPPYTTTCGYLWWLKVSAALWPERREGGMPPGFGRCHVISLRSSTRRSPSCPLSFWPPKTKRSFPGRSVVVWPARGSMGPPSDASAETLVCLYVHSNESTSMTYTSCTKSVCQPPTSTRLLPTSVAVWLQRGIGTSPVVLHAFQTSTTCPSSGLSFIRRGGSVTLDGA
mmetsp:Transcript_8503/g.28173  ORF Transcript_8503/g.28173 Transcript_8503/m.28173 type:complete len:359 (+) Transcript_8503:912-1988(+)